MRCRYPKRVAYRVFQVFVRIVEQEHHLQRTAFSSGTLQMRRKTIKKEAAAPYENPSQYHIDSRRDGSN